MAVIAPFKGITYNFKKMGNVSNLITPPYDVISPEEQEAYYRKHRNNVIRLILGKKKKGDSDWDNRYTRAADFMRRWESEDILTRSTYSSIYLLAHTYHPGEGREPRVRWGFIALVLIEDKGSVTILPHERTFSAHKDDRLKLMRSCNAQLSQVFGLFDDRDNIILKRLKRVHGSQPMVSCSLEDGTDLTMWSIEDRRTFKIVADVMRDKPIFIADGHHRYETARNYRNIMRARYGRGHGNRSYEYIMMYLSDMNDEGLTILPSHRLIKKCEGFHPESFFTRVNRWFEVRELPFRGSGIPDQARDIRHILAEEGNRSPVIGFYFHKGKKMYLLSLRSGALDEMGQELHPALKSLDVLLLSRLILQKSLGFTGKDLDNEEIFHYNSNMSESVSLVHSGEYEMTFLLNPTRMEQVREVAKNSLIMPRKSTYFYPKVFTGLVFNKIDPHEIIQTP